MSTLLSPKGQITLWCPLLPAVVAISLVQWAILCEATGLCARINRRGRVGPVPLGTDSKTPMSSFHTLSSSPWHIGVHPLWTHQLLKCSPNFPFLCETGKLEHDTFSPWISGQVHIIVRSDWLPLEPSVGIAFLIKIVEKDLCYHTCFPHIIYCLGNFPDGCVTWLWFPRIIHFLTSISPMGVVQLGCSQWGYES